MDQPGAPRGETFNPWSVVNLVFGHLAEQGLHPVLGETGDRGPPAADLLRARGSEPAAEGNRRVSRHIQDHVAANTDAGFGGGRPGATCAGPRLAGSHRGQAAAWPGRTVGLPPPAHGCAVSSLADLAVAGSCPPPGALAAPAAGLA